MKKKYQKISTQQLKQLSREIAVKQIKEIGKVKPINITVGEFLQIRHQGLA